MATEFTRPKYCRNRLLTKFLNGVSNQHIVSISRLVNPGDKVRTIQNNPTWLSFRSVCKGNDNVLEKNNFIIFLILIYALPCMPNPSLYV